MQTCYKNLVLGIVFCVSLFALNSSCVFAHNAAPTLYDITALKPGMEFTHRDLKYKSLNKGQINNTEYVKCKVTFSKPITYIEGVKQMVFPKLNIKPFNADKEGNSSVTFSTFIVNLSRKNDKEWRTNKITAYKLGENPSIASYSAVYK